MGEKSSFGVLPARVTRENGLKIVVTNAEQIIGDLASNSILRFCLKGGPFGKDSCRTPPASVPSAGQRATAGRGAGRSTEPGVAKASAVYNENCKNGKNAPSLRVLSRSKATFILGMFGFDSIDGGK